MLYSATIFGVFGVLATTAAGSPYVGNGQYDDSFDNFLLHRSVDDDAEYFIRDLVTEDLMDGFQSLVARGDVSYAGSSCPTDSQKLFHSAESTLACASAQGHVYGCYKKQGSGKWSQLDPSSCANIGGGGGAGGKGKVGAKANGQTAGSSINTQSGGWTKYVAPNGQTDQSTGQSSSKSSGGGRKMRRSMLLTDEEADEVLFRRYVSFLDDIDNDEF